MFAIRPEQPSDEAAIEALLDVTFGADRRRKVSYRYRDGVAPLHELCFVAIGEAGLPVGAIRYWPIRLDDAPALLLGPLAIEPARQGRGVGRALVFHSLEIAGVAGHRIVFLVGDPSYYARFGFGPVPPGIVMPDEAPERLQHRLLDASFRLPESGTLRPCRGRARAAGPARSAAAGKAIASAPGIH